MWSTEMASSCKIPFQLLHSSGTVHWLIIPSPGGWVTVFTWYNFKCPGC